MQKKLILLLAGTLAVVLGFVLTSQGKVELSPYADVSDRSLAELDLHGQEEILKTLLFSEQTIWPETLPPGFNPDRLIEWGKDPGLGVRGLHQRGITGAGVHVALIDKALAIQHQEYHHAIHKYTPLGKPRGNLSHGPAVASILAGRECGVAPGVRIHYYANAANDYSDAIAAVKDVLAYNATSPGDKIRIISISRGFQDQHNLEQWRQIVEQAWQEGVMLLHPDIGWIFGVGCEPYADKDDPEAYQLCIFLAENNSPSEWASKFDRALYFPVDNRTYAYWKDAESYTFEVRGGSSWAVPYAAGVLALGLQVSPQLSNEELLEALYTTATPWEGGRIVNPTAFIDQLMASK